MIGYHVPVAISIPVTSPLVLFRMKQPLSLSIHDSNVGLFHFQIFVFRLSEETLCVQNKDSMNHLNKSHNSSVFHKNLVAF